MATSTDRICDLKNPIWSIQSNFGYSISIISLIISCTIPFECNDVWVSFVKRLDIQIKTDTEKRPPTPDFSNQVIDKVDLDLDYS